MKYARVKCHLKLTFCVFVVSFAQALIGSSFLFMSTLLTELREPLSKIKLTVEEESWIISISILICPVGLLILGVLVDNVGKRITIQVGLVPMTLSWLLLLFADSYQTILIARVLIGFDYGVCGCMILYISEMCPADLRSIYASAITLLVGAGMMMESAMSVYMDWRAISGVMCAMSAVNFLALFAVPEPSMWLRSKGRVEEADRADDWLGLERAENTAAAVAELSATENARPSYWSLYARPAVWKPALITLAFFLFQQCSGVYVLMMYSADVLRSFHVPWNGAALSLSLSAARVLGAVGFALLHRLRRTTLVAVSGCAMAASLFTVVACERAFHRDEMPLAATVAMVVALAAFMFAALMGVLPVPWLLCGEVFPMAVKGVMNGVVQSCGYMIWFTICKIYPSMVVKYGADVVWSVFAVFCILNVLFAVFVMPETKGKSLDEVLSYFEPSEKIQKPNAS